MQSNGDCWISGGRPTAHTRMNSSLLINYGVLTGMLTDKIVVPWSTDLMNSVVPLEY